MIIRRCENEILKISEKEIKNGLKSFDAIDKALEIYNLEEEIILKYEIEMEKKNNDNPNLELTPLQINIIKNKIIKSIYKNSISKK